jgi:hypothetical protein
MRLNFASIYPGGFLPSMGFLPWTANGYEKSLKIILNQIFILRRFVQPKK